MAKFHNCTLWGNTILVFFLNQLILIFNISLYVHVGTVKELRVVFVAFVQA